MNSTRDRKSNSCFSYKKATCILSFVLLIFIIYSLSAIPRGNETNNREKSHPRPVYRTRKIVRKPKTHPIPRIVKYRPPKQHRAHPSDPYRLDVTVPGEQHFHLKAGSPQERQQWLVALGSLKTCLNSEQASHLLLEEDEIKKKFCELRLYCDLLVQQVHSIKSAVIDNPIPDVQKLDEDSALLGDTCDTFIRTVEDCMRLSSPPSPIGYKCTLPEIVAKSPSPESKIINQREKVRPKQNNPKLKHGFVLKTTTPPPEIRSTKVIQSEENEEDEFLESEEEFKPAKENGNSDHFNYPASKTTTSISEYTGPQTFFTSVSASFADLRLLNDGSIPTYEFLECCSSLTKIFDLMGSTAFAPVKMDLNGNIRKLSQSYEANKERFQTLNAIVEYEVEKKTTEVTNSATDALLWLKRGIHFIREFLQCFLDGEQDMSECANKAYGMTLKKHHGWVVRGVFSLAAKASPSREEFIKSLYAEDVEPQPELIGKVLIPYLAGIDRSLKSLDRLYEIHNLDPEVD